MLVIISKIISKTVSLLLKLKKCALTELTMNSSEPTLEPSNVAALRSVVLDGWRSRTEGRNPRSKKDCRCWRASVEDAH